MIESSGAKLQPHTNPGIHDRARRNVRGCDFAIFQSVSPERCLLVLDVRERQDTAKELATAHDTPEARESEQKRSHTTVNVDPNRIYRYNTVRLIEQTPINAKYPLVVCRFYFPGGKPLPLSQVEATIARITAAFQALPGHRASRAQFHTITKVHTNDIFLSKII